MKYRTRSSVVVWKDGKQLSDVPAGKANDKTTPMRKHQGIIMKRVNGFDEDIKPGNINSVLMSLIGPLLHS